MKNNLKTPVSVVIPTFDGLGLLQKNLPAVFRCLRDGDEVVIVDDASKDTTVRWLADAFNTRLRKVKRSGKTYQVRMGRFIQAKKNIRVIILKNKKNIRFARSCNRGVAVAQNSLIFLLNNDVSPHKTALRYLVPHFKKRSVFAVACLELSHSNEQNTPTQQGKNTLVFKRGMFIHSQADNFDQGSTAWATGGSSLYDRAKWLELGGFDPDFAPAYWEDIDLSFRASQRGWDVLFEPKAKVDHNHETTNDSVFGQKKIAAMSWKNAQTFVKKNANWWQKIMYYLWKPYWWLKMK